ncbi:hypothetical protein Tco_1575175 [Tanacetum coccineum]
MVIVFFFPCLPNSSEDSEPTQEVIDILLIPYNLIPPGVEDADSEDEVNESPNLDHQNDPSIPRPPPEPPDIEKCFEPKAGILIIKEFKGVSKSHDFMTSILPTLVSEFTFISFTCILSRMEDTIFDPWAFAVFLRAGGTFNSFFFLRKGLKRQKEAKTIKNRQGTKETRTRVRIQPEITAGSARHSQTQKLRESKVKNKVKGPKLSSVQRLEAYVEFQRFKGQNLVLCCSKAYRNIGANLGVFCAGVASEKLLARNGYGKVVLVLGMTTGSSTWTIGGWTSLVLPLGSTVSFVTSVSTSTTEEFPRFWFVPNDSIVWAWLLCCMGGKPGGLIWFAIGGGLVPEVPWYEIGLRLTQTFAQPLLRGGAGIGMEMSACREVELLNHIFQFSNIWEITRRWKRSYLLLQTMALLGS